MCIPNGSGSLKNKSFLTRPSAAMTVNRTVLVCAELDMFAVKSIEEYTKIEKEANEWRKRTGIGKRKREKRKTGQEKKEKQMLCNGQTGKLPSDLPHPYTRSFSFFRHKLL